MSDNKGITSNSNTPYMKLKSVAVNSAKWTGGFWADRFAVGATNAVWTVRYGQSRWNGELLDGTKIALNQETQYTWSGRISITVELESDVEFSLMLRIPSWAKEYHVEVQRQGKTLFDDQSTETGCYYELTRSWSSGDTIMLDLPMEPRLIEAHHLVEESRGQVSVLRGPVVYCLESADISTVNKLEDLLIPRDINLTPQSGIIENTDIVFLQGKFVSRKTEDWGDQLYREITVEQPDYVHTRMVPYFCWDNRGLTDMSVWIPLA